MTTVVNFENVSIQRGRNKIFDGLNLNLESGKLIGLLGPSGAGKSTIMRAIVGVQSGIKGSIGVLGGNPGTGELLKRVAYSTQSSSIFDDISVKDNLAFTAKILGAPKSSVTTVLSQVQLNDVAKRKAGSLSGGQRNRVSLAMALIGNPDVLVLDEPTVGLDPVLRADLWSLFRELANQGKTLLISSHVMDEAERCDEIIFVREGKVIAHDSLPNVLSQTNSTSAEDAFLTLARRTNV